MDHHDRKIGIYPQNGALAAQDVLYYSREKALTQVVLIKSDDTQGHTIRRNTLGDKISNIPIRMLICAKRPPAIETPRLFFLHLSEMLHSVGCFTWQPTGEHVDILLREFAEDLILLAARLHAGHQQVVLLVVQSRIRILGMLPQDALELRFDLRAIVGIWEFFLDRHDQIVRLMPGFLFRYFQHVLKVALNGCFHGLIALDMLQVPNTKAHQRRRREHDGQLQRQQGSRAVRQSPLLSHSQPRQILHSPYTGKTIKASEDELSR